MSILQIDTQKVKVFVPLISGMPGLITGLLWADSWYTNE